MSDCDASGDGRAISGCLPGAAPRGGIRAWGPGILCAALSGGLLFLAFPPADLWPLAYVALVPLLVALDGSPSYGRAVLYGAVAAAAACVPAFAWVASVAVSGWLGLSAYVGLYLIVGAAAVRLFQRRFRRGWPLLGALLWVGLELCRARLGPGFPWLFLGYTQYRFGGLLQLAALGGVYAVSFVVFLVGACLAALASDVVGRAGGRAMAGSGLAFCGSLWLLAVCALVGGSVREEVALSDGPVVGVVQQNLPRLVEEIFDPAKTTEDVCREREAEVQLCAQLTARLRGRGVRLVVWPESTVSVPLDIPAEFFAVRQEQGLQEQALGYFRQLGGEMGCYFLVGAPSYVSRQAARSLLYGVEATVEFGNCAVMVSPEGAFVERYDKMRLVPFGEYIPLVDLLPFLQLFTPIPRGISAGTEAVIFTLPTPNGGEPVRFGALVCYEGVFADLCAQFRRKGAQMLINVTDEGWYYIPGELRQHLAMDVFRAVETRTTVVRAANTGISCFISPRGEVYASLPPLTEGVLSAPVKLCDRITPYVRHGDAFAVACLMLVIALPPLAAALGRRSKV